eukprot:COSAG03_NODE_8911_length_761_cov_0.968278_1_plen_59_part_00
MVLGVGSGAAVVEKRGVPAQPDTTLFFTSGGARASKGVLLVTLVTLVTHLDPKIQEVP